MTDMVKRNNYSQKFKNKLSAEICGGASPAVISKREGISVQTLNKWKNDYLIGEDSAHLSKSEISEMRKKLSELSVLYSEAMLENFILKKNRKKSEDIEEKRKLIRILSQEFGVEKSCKTMKMSVSTFYYQKKPKSDESHIVQIIDGIIKALPGAGYRTVTAELRKKNISLNHKKVLRLMRENNLISKKSQTWKRFKHNID